MGPGRFDRCSEVSQSCFQASFVLRERFSRIRGGLMSRELTSRCTEGYTDGEIGMAKPTTNPALLRLAVRREEGGQVESWVSESVGGAEHA